MAADFWLSSHHKRWIVDRATAHRAREQDRQILRYLGQDVIHLDYFAIYFANVITKLGKKLGLRQRVIATATVFFRRFYLKNSYSETDPFLVIAACCYVAAKAEESPVHIKTVISEARTLFSQDMYNIKHFPTDNSKLAEMEFYLVDDLECDLTIFHPYRSLFALCKKECEEPTNTNVAVEDNEPGAYITPNILTGNNALGLGVGIDDATRYWGTGEGKLELSAGALQTAWFIINDTYRSDICLLYPPHLIAVAAIYLTFILHTPTRSTITPLLTSSSSSSLTPPPTAPPTTATATTAPAPTTTKPIRRSTRHSTSSSSLTSPPIPPNIASQQQAQQDPITFLSELNISLPLVATISQEIISLYTLWERYKEDAHPEAKSSTTTITTTTTTPSNNDITTTTTPNTTNMDTKEDDSSSSADMLYVDTTPGVINNDTTAAGAAGAAGSSMTTTRKVPQRMKEVVPRELSDLLYNMRVARLELDGSFSSSSSSSSSSRGTAIHGAEGGGSGSGAIYISHHHHQQQQQQGYHHHQQSQQRQSQYQQHQAGYTTGGGGGGGGNTGKMATTGTRGGGGGGGGGAAVNKMLERTQNAG